MENLRRRILVARILAVVADAVQVGFLPLFVGGAPEGFDAVLDVVMGGTMLALLGWHWAFVPAFLAELVPVVDLAPSWTIAVLLATRRMDQTSIPVEVTRVDPPGPPMPQIPPMPRRLPPGS